MKAMGGVTSFEVFLFVLKGCLKLCALTIVLAIDECIQELQLFLFV